MTICSFCKIVKKQSPLNIVFEDGVALALTPLERVSIGHTILMPKKHFENIFDVDEEIFSHLARVMRELAIKVVKEKKATGINLLNASGKDAQQSVSHLHFHLVPRYPKDGLDMWIKQTL